jgi:hypothetical protein
MALAHQHHPFTNIPFGTDATLVLTNVQPTARRFHCRDHGREWIVGDQQPLVSLVVVLPPSVTGQPTNGVGDVGGSATFSVVHQALRL